MLIRKLDLNNNNGEALLTKPEGQMLSDDGFRYGLFAEKQPMAYDRQTDLVCHVNEHELWLQMAPGGHGNIQRLNVSEKGLHQKTGERVGESMTCFISAGYSFELKCHDETYTCMPGEAVCICLEAGEYQAFDIFADREIQLIRLNCIMLNPQDFSRDIGVEMIKSEEGYSKARLKLKEEHRGMNGYVDPGILFSMADEMCGQAAATVGGICTTVNCTIEYIKMPKIGEYIYGEALPTKMGRTIRNYTAYIRDENHELICLADAIFFNLQK